LLNFTRAFARQKAKEEGLDEQLSKLHLDYCLSLIQQSVEDDSGQDSWEEDLLDLLAAAKAAPSIGVLQAVWRISRAIGPFLKQRGLWSEREQLNRASVKAATTANRWGALERSLIDLGIILEAQGRWNEAAAQYRQNLFYANRNATQNLAHQASALEHLGRVLSSLGDHAGSERARRKLEEITARLEPQANTRALDAQGRIFQDQGELVKSYAMYLEAFHIRVKIGDFEGVARSRRNLGIILTLRMDWQAAEDELLKSLDYWTSQNIIREQAIIKHLLADLFRRQGRLSDARICCDECLQLREGDPKGIAVTKALLAKILVAKGDYQPAIDALQESCKLCCLLGDTEGESIAYDQIGAINALQQEWDEALDAFGKSRQLKESNGRRDIVGLGITWDRIAQVQARRCQWGLARDAYTKSLGYSLQAGRKLIAAVDPDESSDDACRPRRKGNRFEVSG
jgi:tetratricopeptide (TPR) repeat protein